MKVVRTGRQLSTTLRNASRLRTIVSTFARHGFAKLAEKIRLGKFLVERVTSQEELNRLSLAERVRMAFTELGPTFIKLGQILASRPDLVPEDFVLEFAKLHDQVPGLEFSSVQEILRQEFGEKSKTLFRTIEEVPLGSASIAQVHRAELANGTPVVIKVQRPGIVPLINDDLNILYLLAGLLQKYIPEVRAFNLSGIVDEYYKTLQLETNFVVEANNIRRFGQNFRDEPDICIPKVYFEYTTERVLVMEAIPGKPLSQIPSFEQTGAQEAQDIIRKCLKAYLKMVFLDGLFHADLHAGNFFVLPNQQIGLVDFGSVGRLNHRTQSAIASMLLALAKEDYERLAFDYIDLTPFSERVDVDVFARELRDVIAPYYGLTLRHVNLGRLLLSSSAVAGRQGLVVPNELMLFFKSLVHIEALGKHIRPDFDFLTEAIGFSDELIKKQFEPSQLSHELAQLGRESKHLVTSLPRQINFLMRKWSSPDHVLRFELSELPELGRSIEKSFQLVFLGLVIGSLVVASALLYQTSPSGEQGATIAGIPSLSFVGFVTALVLSVISFVRWIKE